MILLVLALLLVISIPTQIKEQGASHPPYGVMKHDARISYFIEHEGAPMVAKCRMYDDVVICDGEELVSGYD